MTKEEVDVSPLNFTNKKTPPPEDYKVITINGFIVGEEKRKVGTLSRSSMIRPPVQWLHDLMNSENCILIQRVIEPDGRRYLIIDRVKEAE